ncbi:MAG: N-acetyltransferase [Chloroflexi bacterium]|nr:N-acetyltransferase [Chloroflexota bacterium]|tara:strand:+ start:649 stop:1269 length:621 start_codon:yes stop_codon:yes gene_type:complete
MPIFGKSKIGDSCFIDSNALIGYPARDELNLLETNSDQIKGCSIGNNSQIRPGAIYSTAKVGNNTRTGHNFLVRENTTVGNGCLIGTNVVIDNDCQIGDNCSFQTGAYIPTGSKIGNRVFLGPNASLTNDKNPLRTEYNPEPITIEDDATIGSNATLMPGITIGEGAFVAGGAVVTKDVPAWTLAKGCPAKFSELPESLKKPNRLG